MTERNVWKIFTPRLVELSMLTIRIFVVIAGHQTVHFHYISSIFPGTVASMEIALAWPAARIVLGMEMHAPRWQWHGRLHVGYTLTTPYPAPSDFFLSVGAKV